MPENISERRAEQFWQRVDKRQPDECWPWLLCTDGKYGKFSLRGVEFKAPRVAYYLRTGTDPGELDVCHSCDNPICCNPAHLSLGTRSQNLREMVARGRKVSRPLPGELNPMAKLTEDDVYTIREKYATGKVTQRELAAEYGVARSLIGRLVKGRSWQATTKGKAVAVQPRGWKLRFARVAEALAAKGLGLRRGERYGFVVRYRAEGDAMCQRLYLSLADVERAWLPEVANKCRDGVGDS